MYAPRERLFMVILCFVCTMLTACTGRSQPSMSTASPAVQLTGAQRLRLVNNSDTTFEQLRVRFPNDDVDFGRVEAGATTEYRAVPRGVYGYAAYDFTIDGRALAQPVTDWVGETAMNGNAFTYVLTVSQESGNVFVNAEVQRDE